MKRLRFYDPAHLDALNGKPSDEVSSVGLSKTQLLSPAQRVGVTPPVTIANPKLFNKNQLSWFSESVFVQPEIGLHTLKNVTISGRYLAIFQDSSAVAADLRPRPLPHALFGSGFFRESDEGSNYARAGDRAVAEHKGHHFLLASTGDHMHHHWLYDVCTKLYVWENHLDRQCQLAVPSICKPYMRSFYRDLGIEDSQICEFDTEADNQFEKLTITQSFAQADHLWPEAFFWFRDRVFNTYGIDIKSARATRHIFVNRMDTKGSDRTLLNEPEIEQILLQRGFESVCPGDLSIKEQVQLFSEIDVGVIVHGSGGANVLFANPNSRFLHIHPDCVGSFRTHGRVSGLLGNEYAYVLGTSFHRPARAHNNPWIVDPQDVLANLKPLL